MKQLEINIDQYGIYKIMSIFWNRQGQLDSITVDWYRTGEGALVMYDYDGTGEFQNSHGNLKGKIC